MVADRPTQNREPLSFQSVSCAYGHNSRVFDVTFCPSSCDFMASAADDETAKVWRHEQGRWVQCASFLGHSDSVMRVTWAPEEENLLASGSADTTVQLWRFDTGAESGTYAVEEVGALRGHPEEVYACEFVDGHSLVTASCDALFLWDLDTGVQVQESKPSAETISSAGLMPPRWQPGHVFCVRQQPEGHLMAASCSDGALRFWAHDSGSSLQPLSTHRLHQSIGSACAWTPDGQQVASVAKDGHVALWDIRKQQVVIKIQCDVGLLSCSFLPAESAIMAASGTDGAVHILDLWQGSGAGLQLHPEGGLQTEPLLCMAVAGNGDRLVAAGEAQILLDDSASISMESIPFTAGNLEDSLFAPFWGPPDQFQDQLHSVNNHKQSKWAPLYVWENHGIAKG